MSFERFCLSVPLLWLLVGIPLAQGGQIRFHRMPSADDQSTFLGVEAAHSYVIRADGFSLMRMSAPRAEASATWEGHSDGDGAPRSYNLTSMRLEGADPSATASGRNRVDGLVNYIRTTAGGSQSGLPRFERIYFQEVYPGIDIEYYGAPGGLEYDFVVSPGADPSRIRFEVERGGAARINDDGDLLLGGGQQPWRQGEPVAYQLLAGVREPVQASYARLDEGGIGIELGDYDPRRELIIDPVVFSRQIPGDRDDRLAAVAIDEDGFIYAGGFSASSDVPIVNAFQPQRGGPILNDGYIALFTPDGQDVAFATYLGGSQTDTVSGIAVDQDGFVYVTGWTDSPDFPTTENAYQRTHGGDRDIFVSKLTPDGSELVYSTYIGTAMRDVGERIRLDTNGEAYIAGSSRGADFPTTPGASQPSFGGGDIDAVILKLGALGDELVWSTFYGGSGSEVMQDMEIDASGRAVVSGETTSDDLPTTSDAPQAARGGGVDAFVAALGPASELLYSTYLGGERADRPFGLALGLFNSILVTGGTSSPDFPAGDSGQGPLTVDPPVDGFLTALPAPAAMTSGAGAASLGASQSSPGDGITPPTQLRTFFDSDFGFNVGRDVDLLRESAGGSIAGVGVSFDLDAPGTRFASELEVFPLDEVYAPSGSTSPIVDGVQQSSGQERTKIKHENLSGRDSSTVPVLTRYPAEARVGLLLAGVSEDATGSGDGGFVRFRVPLETKLAITKRLTDGATGSVISGAGLLRRFIDTVALDSTVTFEIVIRNVGLTTATEVTFTDTLPLSWDIERSGVPPMFSLSATEGMVEEPCRTSVVLPGLSRVTCKVGGAVLGLLEPRKKVVLELKAVVDAPSLVRGRIAITATNTACAKAANADTVCKPLRAKVLPGRREDLASKLNLGVSLVPDPIPAGLVSETSPQQAGGRARLLIGVENETDAEINGVRVSSKLPPQLRNPRIVNGHNICRIFPGLAPFSFGLDLLTCRQEILRARTRMDVAVEGDLPLGRTRITAGARLEANDLFPTPRLASDSKVFGEDPAADLRTILNLDGPATETQAGGCMVCQQARVTVANAGLSVASGTTATVRRGVGGLTFADPGPMCTAAQEVSCDFGDLESGDSVSSTFEVCLPCDRADVGASVLNASSRSSTPDLSSQNNFNRLVYRPSAVDGEGAVVINPGGVIDTAKFGARGLAPGSDPSLFGTGLADGLAVATSLPLPTVLNGVSVDVNGFPAPLIFVSPNQINFQTPWEIADEEWVDVVVRRNGEFSDPERVFVTPFDPGLFSLSQTGSGQGAILIAGTATVPAPEGSVAGGRPVRAGEFLSLFAVGLGPVENQPLSGAVAPVNPFATTKLTPQVTIGGTQASVLFSGLAPGLAGVYQVNVEIPAGVSPGDAVEVQLTIGGVSSNIVTIAIGT